MTLRLSKLHLRAILILVVSQSKGITLVFKNDPLQNVDVSSTFDSIEVIRGYLQQEIEGQLREMFREDLPGIIHRLSQQWFAGAGTGGRVEMPYRDEAPSVAMGQKGDLSDSAEDEDSPFATKPLFPPHPSNGSAGGLSSSPAATSNVNVTPRKRVSSSTSIKGRRASESGGVRVSSSPSAYTTFPDIEDYDPTYGLRPEGVPTHSGYEAFGRLWEKSREGGRGLGSLMKEPIGEGPLLEEDEEEEEIDGWAASRHEGDVSDLEDEPDLRHQDHVGDVDDLEDDLGGTSVDAVDPQLLRTHSRRHIGSHLAMSAAHSQTSRQYDEDEYDTFPAVGGGFITRPRVYHAQSQIVIKGPGGTPQSAASDVGAANSPAGTAGTGSVTARAASSVAGASSTIGSLRNFGPMHHNRFPSSASVGSGPGLAGMARGAIPGPGPSTLRRMTTSRSDVFLSRPATHLAPHSPTPARRGMSNSISYGSFVPLVTPGRMVQHTRGADVPLSRRHSGASQSRSGRPLHQSRVVRGPPPPGSRITSPTASQYRPSSVYTDSRPSRSATLSTMPSSQSMSIPIPASDIGRSPSKQSSIGMMGRPRAASVVFGASPTSFPPRHSQGGLTGITLPPLNNSVSQLATLSHSAQTLSPYARAHEHVAVRSFPYGLNGAAGPGSGSGSGSGGLHHGGSVGLGVVMGSDVSAPSYSQASKGLGSGADGRVGRVVGRAGAMAYASQMQKERYEESKAAYANGGDEVRGTRKRFFDLSSHKKPDSMASQTDGLKEGMAGLHVGDSGVPARTPGVPKTPGVNERPKLRERVSYGFPRA